ncbi:unnamed protein product [Brassicogethes aeneus]|uniref:Uncharacterized protein n=1 Tax=Brassicogethes aeneus TaxID=1431903 RepID=A0A9P0AR35_BRAAE|nr:unnamed protein product [Brassicogethes aeneus]
MKQVLFCCVLAVTLYWSNAKPAETSPKDAVIGVLEVLKKISEKSLECKAEYKISDELFNKIQNSEKVDSPEAKQYMHCFLLKMGIQKANGEFDAEAVSQIMRSGKPLTKEELNCLKPKGTPEESAYEFYKCFN